MGLFFSPLPLALWAPKSKRVCLKSAALLRDPSKDSVHESRLLLFLLLLNNRSSESALSLSLCSQKHQWRNKNSDNKLRGHVLKLVGNPLNLGIGMSIYK